MHIVNRSSAWVRRGAAASIAAAIALGVMPGVALASDIDGHWGEASLQQWADYGVLQGYGDGNYGPNDHITRAELVTLLDRVMDYQNSASNTFEDLDDNWYTENVLKGVAAGIITGDQNGTDLIRPNDHLTREEAAAIFARVMGLDTAAAPSAGFVDQDKIADWATGSVNAMKAAGYVNGFEGSFNPTDNLTRAEAVTILDNIFSDLYQSAGEFTGEVEGSAVINSGDVTLKDAVVDGDLVIAEGVADGHVVLDNVTVKGKLIVRGGGINSVIIKGDSQISQVHVARQGAGVRIAVEGSSQVGTVVVDNGADAVKIEGAVETVNVQGAFAAVEVTGAVGSLAISDSAENAKVTISTDATVGVAETSASGAQLVVSGSVESVAVKGEGTTVKAESGATISKVTTEAANTKVEGAGTVGSVVAGEGSEGTVVDTNGTKVENTGSGSVSAGGETVAPGGSVTTPDSSTGGGGGSTVVTTASVSTFDELKSALENATIKTVNVTGSITATDAIAVNKTVNVQSGATLNVMGEKLSGTGTVVVQSGGTLKIDANYNGGEGSLLPSIKTIEVQPGGTLASQTTNAENAESATDVVFVGTGDSARIQTGESTTVTLGFADAYGTSGEGATRPTMTISGNASVPTGQTWYTMFDSDKEAIGIDMTVASGTLTVSGILKATSANNTGSSLTIAEVASLVVAAKGTLEIAKKAAVTVNGTATSEGDITGTGSFTAPGFVKDGNAWVKKFASGLGTAASPYQISTAAEFGNIVSGTSADAQVHYQLTNDLDLKDAGNGIVSASNFVFDGQKHKLYSSEDHAANGVFKQVSGSVTIKNLAYDLTNLDYSSAYPEDLTGLVYEVTGSGTNLTFQNVTIEGSHSVGSNNAPFIMVESMTNGSITFDSCEMAAELSGVGYNACFIGWQTNTSGAAVTLKDCVVSGELVCPRASIVTANGTNAGKRTYDYMGTNVLSGTVRGTEVAKYFTPVSESGHTVLEEAATTAFKTEGAGALFVGQTDSSLAISVGEDGRVTVTPSDNREVTSYVVRIGMYTTLYDSAGVDSGTWKFFATQTINASDLAGAFIIPAHKFIDANYSGLGEITADASGNKVATLGDETYYVVQNYVYDDGSGLQGFVGSPSAPGIKAPELISVDAYVGDVLYSTASFKK